MTENTVTVDLRSDTVTRPTPEMFEAMRTAILGDDVLGDDPTVKELESLGAKMVGKEAAVFVPSGTMSNQIALATHCRPGDAVILEEDAHILYYEGGSPAIIASAMTWTLPSYHGAVDPADIKRRLLKRSAHNPETVLLCLENTHNRAGGAILPVDTMAAYRDLADHEGFNIHLDGARVFNAAIALNRPVTDITSQVDSVSVCLSKGLRSPVGSLLCGSRTFIEQARSWRQRLGGGMRQAGILAACGLVSLTKMVDRLADDHRRARELAEHLASLDGLTIDLTRVQTNMVMVATQGPAQAFAERLSAEGVHFFAVGERRVRLVIHADIDDAKLAHAKSAFSKVASESAGRR
jgi:threonine aldolase